MLGNRANVYKIADWNQFATGKNSTNNSVEAWNNYAGNKLFKARAGFWRFIQALKDYQLIVEVTKAQCEAGHEVRQRNRKLFLKLQMTERVVRDFQFSRINLAQLWRYYATETEVQPCVEVEIEPNHDGYDSESSFHSATEWDGELDSQIEGFSDIVSTENLTLMLTRDEKNYQPRVSHTVVPFTPIAPPPVPREANKQNATDLLRLELTTVSESGRTCLY